MVVVSLPVLTRKSPNQQKSYQNHHHPLLLPLTISYPSVVTLAQLLVVMIIVRSVAAAVKAPVIMYHSFSSAEPILSMTDSGSSNQLRLHTHHGGHLYRKHEMDSVTKKASSR